MLEGLKKVVPVAAFVALVLFFGNELWRSSNNPAQSARQISEPHSAKKPNESKQDESQWYRRTFFWLTHDAAGFFTLWLVVVGGGQVLLFYVQLKLIREASDISAAQS